MLHSTTDTTYLAPTSDEPVGLNVLRAEGIYLFDTNEKRYIDLISGISVNNLGHQNPMVIKAIEKQAREYLHVMAYGEYNQGPQLELARKLSGLLPDRLNCTYLVNSGSEAVEGALKLARRYTGRKKIIAIHNGYHGSTFGAMSVMGSDKFNHAFTPLLPNIEFMEFNSDAGLNKIDKDTACVIIEPVQGEAGAIPADRDYLENLRRISTEKGCLLIFDEVQTGMGRTGSFFALDYYGVTPDVLVLAKAFGGGMPLGAFIASNVIMDSLKSNPVLGHITTFGGHPVCCAAAIASIDELLKQDIIASVAEKESLFREKLVHHRISGISGKGLLLALHFDSDRFAKTVIKNCLANGLLTDWFLFAEDCLRISPPLIITVQEIEESCGIIIKSINEVQS